MHDATQGPPRSRTRESNLATVPNAAAETKSAGARFGLSRLGSSSLGQLLWRCSDQLCGAVIEEFVSLNLERERREKRQASYSYCTVLVLHSIYHHGGNINTRFSSLIYIVAHSEFLIGTQIVPLVVHYSNIPKRILAIIPNWHTWHTLCGFPGFQ